MTSILSQPGFWVGTAIAVGFVLAFGVLRRSPWWRTALSAAGAVAFVVGLQWAWSIGLDALLAAGLASLGMAVWGETLLGLAESRVRPEMATASVPIPVGAEASALAVSRPRPKPATARSAASNPAGERLSQRAKPSIQAKAKPEARTQRAARTKRVVTG